jgi:hypothetical protein
MPAFLQLKWAHTTTSPKQSIPWPPNIRGFKVDNTHCKCSKKDQFDLGLSQKKPQILSYISLVRSTMEYGGIIWDPYTETNINRLERIQRQAPIFITGDYRSQEEGSVSNMLVKLELQDLKREERARNLSSCTKWLRGWFLLLNQTIT